MEWLSRYLLQGIEAYESEKRIGPTMAELADEIGLPPHFGRQYLVERLQRQVALGRISHHGRRFRLTEDGHEELLFHEWGSRGPPDRISDHAPAAEGFRHG